jgi:hypothetical protein
MLLGNDLAGDKVFPDTNDVSMVLGTDLLKPQERVDPVVVSQPSLVSVESDQNLYPACAVTRSMTKDSKMEQVTKDSKMEHTSEVSDSTEDLGLEGSMFERLTSVPAQGLSHITLVGEQLTDPELEEFRNKAVTGT